MESLDSVNTMSNSLPQQMISMMMISSKVYYETTLLIEMISNLHLRVLLTGVLKLFLWLMSTVLLSKFHELCFQGLNLSIMIMDHSYL